MNIFANLSLGFHSRLPVILQTEAAECGLACLSMIASYHGYRMDIGAIRRHFSATLKGLTLRNLTDIAGNLALSARAVRLEVEELSELKKPCILHWDFNHFVVLDRVTATGITIHDPARGRRHIGWPELDRSFTGVALEVWPQPTFVPKVEREQLRIISLFKNIVGLRRYFLQIFLLAVSIEVFMILSPLGLQIIIDQALISSDLDLVAIISLGLLLIVVLQAISSFVQAWTSMILMTQLHVYWRTGLFAHLLRLPLAFFEKRHVGDIISRFGAIATIQRTLTTDLVASLMDGLVIIGMLIMMLMYSISLTAVALLISLLYLVMRLLFYYPYRSASEAELVFQAKENSHFIETVRGAASVKSLGLEGRRRETWFTALADAINAQIKIDKLDIMFNFGNRLLFGVGRILMLWIGGRAVIRNEITVGMLMAFSAYQDQFIARVSSLIGMLFQLRMLTLQGERIADIALTKPESDTDQISSPAIEDSSKLQTVNLHFRYGDGEPDILRGISLAIEAGENVAIVGPSGCGKSTLLKALAGLVQPTGGRVVFGGRDIRDIGLDSYRRITGCVLQDDRLFSGTLLENIAGFESCIDNQWARECARMAAIHNEIDQMPMTYESFVGDMGSTLSGGQKQRIFLARALYRKPQILFLDEATSHLDMDNEALINDILATLKITRITVAHRPATISMADRVITLDKLTAQQ